MLSIAERPCDALSITRNSAAAEKSCDVLCQSHLVNRFTSWGDHAFEFCQDFWHQITTESLDNWPQSGAGMPKATLDH